MPDEDNKILKYIPGKKSLRAPFINYADLECLFRINTCHFNPEKSYTEQKATHKLSGYSIVTCCSFDKSRTECEYYRGEDCMKMFCKDLKDQAKKIINYEKKEMIPLTDKEKEAHENQKIYYICEQEFCTDKNNKKEFKLNQKVSDHCHYTGKYRGAAHSICNLRDKIPKDIPVVFHNGSIYDYHFIIKQLAGEFKDNFECLGVSNEKNITFSVPIKNEHDNGKPTICKLKFIDSYRFMQDSLSNLVDNLSDINKEPENKFVDTMRSMMNSLSQSINKILVIDKKIMQIDKKEKENKFIDNMRSMVTSLSQSIDKISDFDNKISYGELIEKLFNTYQLFNKDFNKFTLLLRKGVYPDEYIDSWKRFKEESLPDKESFYSELNKEHITDEDYAHAQKVRDTFKIKNLGEYHDLYVQSDTLLLADIFENFRDKCIKIYELDPAHFLSAP